MTELEAWHRQHIRAHLETIMADQRPLDCQTDLNKRLFIDLYQQVLSGRRDCRFCATLKRRPGSSMQETILANSFRELTDTLMEAKATSDDVAEIATDISSHGQLTGFYKLSIPPELYADFLTA